MKTIMALAVGGVLAVGSVTTAFAQVVRGVPCNRQATYDLCVKCIGKRGGGGATGGRQFCTNTWRPAATFSPIKSS